MRDEDIANIIEHSFLDYHVKGFSYLCLKRSAEHTIKLYFFDGDVEQMPEVVSPHDHRYNFRTECLAGCVENRLYMPRLPGDRDAVTYQRFEYRTPLNGGNGFTWAAEECLGCTDAKSFDAGQCYVMSHDAIHTIQLRASGTILKLDQYKDRVPLKRPTATYTLDREPPPLSGLYRKPNADDVLRLLAIAAAARFGSGKGR